MTKNTSEIIATTLESMGFENCGNVLNDEMFVGRFYHEKSGQIVRVEAFNELVGTSWFPDGIILKVTNEDYFIKGTNLAEPMRIEQFAKLLEDGEFKDTNSSMDIKYVVRVRVRTSLGEMINVIKNNYSDGETDGLSVDEIVTLYAECNVNNIDGSITIDDVDIR